MASSRARARPTSFALRITASLGASVLFGVLFLIPPLLHPLDDLEIVAWRVVATVAVLVVLIGSTGGLRDVRAVLARVRRRPLLAVVLVVDAALLAVQLWLFGWAPISGHGLDVATGYLLVPLALVLVGVVVRGERLSRLRLAAVAVAAAAGVGAALLLGGAVGIADALVYGPIACALILLALESRTGRSARARQRHEPALDPAGDASARSAAEGSRQASPTT